MINTKKKTKKQNPTFYFNVILKFVLSIKFIEVIKQKDPCSLLHLKSK